VKLLIVPLADTMSPAVNPTGASLKLKVTSELLSPLFNESSVMLTRRLGAVVSSLKLALVGAALLPASSVSEAETVMVLSV
jgi:hypothetical protein